jgi:hypothetical protein
MGRKDKPWYEIARLQLWYWPVNKLMGARPDYRLDCNFAYKRQLTPSEGKHRRRVFEWIRKTGREPNGGHPNLRTIEEIIDAVNMDPRFHGTADIYRSSFWELFLLDEIRPEEIMRRLNSFFEKHQLVRCPPEAIPAYKKSGIISRFSNDYRRFLSKTLDSMDGFSAGYLECLLNFQKRSFDGYLGIFEDRPYESEYLKKYFETHLDEKGEVYHYQAVKKINEISVIKRVRNSEIKEHGWGEITWPICKKDAALLF